MSMWNKRPDEPMPRPMASTPVTPEPKKEITPVSPTPNKTIEPEVTRGQASIGKAVKINGQILSKEDLYIDGDVEGTVELNDCKLTIGPNGRVQAAIRAREVIVLGAIQGNVEASDRIDIRKEARLIGDIKTARIVIEDGAYFKGSIDIVKAEVKQAAPAAAQVPIVPLGGQTAAAPATSQPTAPAAPKPVVAAAGAGSEFKR